MISRTKFYQQRKYPISNLNASHINHRKVCIPAGCDQNWHYSKEFLEPNKISSGEIWMLQWDVWTTKVFSHASSFFFMYISLIFSKYHCWHTKCCWYKETHPYLVGLETNVFKVAFWIKFCKYSVHQQWRKHLGWYHI